MPLNGVVVEDGRWEGTNVMVKMSVCCLFVLLAVVLLMNAWRVKWDEVRQKRALSQAITSILVKSTPHYCIAGVIC
jgi:hypothetical protein